MTVQASSYRESRPVSSIPPPLASLGRSQSQPVIALPSVRSRVASGGVTPSGSPLLSPLASPTKAERDRLGGGIDLRSPPAAESAVMEDTGGGGGGGPEVASRPPLPLAIPRSTSHRAIRVSFAATPMGEGGTDMEATIAALLLCYISRQPHAFTSLAL